jgi:hypothetical protein
MPVTLLQYLVEMYGRLSADRVQHGENQILVQIDDLGRNGAFAGYCEINVQFSLLDDDYTLILTNAPLNREIETLVQSHGGTVINSDHTKEIRLKLAATDSEFIFELAAAIGRAAATKPGSWRYPDPNLEWRQSACPRANYSLREFAFRLLEFCGSQHHPSRKESQ